MPAPRDSDRQSTILIVDDQPGNIDLLRKYLQRREYTLAAATSGEQALRLAPKLQPDLILLDVMMPGLDGYQTCERLRQEPTTRHIPVVFVTAKTQPEDIERGFAAGAADYLCKPVQHTELLVRVGNQLSLKRARDAQLQQLQDTAKLAELGHLVGALAHEIATPLGNTLLVLGAIEERLPTLQAQMDAKTVRLGDLQQFVGVVRESLEISREALRFADTLVQGYKSVAVDQCADTRCRIQVGPYLDKVLLSLRPKLKHTGFTLTVEGPGLLEVDTYPGALVQIVTNLVDNSLIHGFAERSQGRIALRFGEQDGRLVLDYSDDGRGIAAEHLPHVFESYFTTRPGRGGSGLGMSIVHALVIDKLGGTIECSSTPGSGARFVMTLPMKP